MAALTTCPAKAEYDSMARGLLPDDRLEQLLQHLEHCDHCLQTVRGLQEQDTLTEFLRSRKEVSPLAEGQPIQALMQKLHGLGALPVPSGGEATLPPDPTAIQSVASGDAKPIRLECPSCHASLKLEAELAGKKVRCPKCKETVTVPPAGRPATGPAREQATVAPDLPVSSEASPLADPPVSWPATLSSDLPASSRAMPGSAPKGAASCQTEELYDFLAPPQGPGEIGWLGPYRVLKVLGAGGMGVVFQAEDPQLQRLVALKAMLPALAASSSARQRFLREARAAAAIKHDHIVSIYQVGEDRGAPFLAMEFLDGEPLDKRLEREKKLPLPEVLRIGREMAEGLAAAHERNLIHRDVKPGNVWLEGKRGRVKILDFGLARSTADQANLTQQGAIVGTPAYMAPEQAQGTTIDGRCDLFSLGCVLYRLTTGRLPFKGTDTVSVLASLLMDTPKSVQELNPDLPPALAELIMQLLSKDPAGRPASAQAVVATLQAIEHDLGQPDGTPKPRKTAQAASSSKGSPPPKRSGPSRWLLAGAAAVVLVGLSLAGWVIIRNKKGEEVGRLAIPESGTVEVRTDPDNSRPDAPLVPGKPLARSPFDQLKRADIPAEELKTAGGGDAAQAPAELVGVIGDSRFKHWLPFNYLTYSADGKRLITAEYYEAEPNKVRTWDAKTGRELAAFIVNGPVAALSSDGRLLATLQGDRKGAKVWDVDAGKLLWSSPLHTAEINGAAFSADGKRLATGSSDKTVQVCAAATGQRIQTIKELALPVWAVAFNGDGTRLALAVGPEAATEAGAVKVWDVDNGKEIVSLTGHAERVRRLAFSPDGRHLAGAALRDRGWLWDLPAGGKPHDLTEGAYINGTPQFSPDSKRLVLATKVIDPVSKQPSFAFPGEVFCTAWSPDGKRLAGGGGQNCIQILDATTGQPLFVPGSPTPLVRSLAVSPDGRLVALFENIIGRNSSLSLWEVPTGRLVFTKQYGSFPSTLVFSPDGSNLASSFQGEIVVWETGTGKIVGKWRKHNLAGGLAYSPDGGLLVSCSSDGAKVWKALSGEDVCTYRGHPKGVFSAAFSPDGKRVVSGGLDATVKVWDAASGQEILSLSDVFQYSVSVCWSRDGRRIAGGTSERCKLWEAQTGKEVAAPEGTSPLAYSPDGSLLASRSQGSDGALNHLTVWDGQTGGQRRQWQLPGQFENLAFSPDGRHIVTSNANGTLYVFRLAAADK